MASPMCSSFPISSSHKLCILTVDGRRFSTRDRQHQWGWYTRCFSYFASNITQPFTGIHVAIKFVRLFICQSYWWRCSYATQTQNHWVSQSFVSFARYRTHGAYMKLCKPGLRGHSKPTAEGKSSGSRKTLKFFSSYRRKK